VRRRELWNTCSFCLCLGIQLACYNDHVDCCTQSQESATSKAKPADSLINVCRCLVYDIVS